MISPVPHCRLYLITPPRIELPGYLRELADAFDGGDVACLQLRLKDCEDDKVREAYSLIQPICDEYDVALLVNDRPDLAAEFNSDGVHIGQEDGTYAEARRAVGAEATVGVTCHNSRHLAMVAGEEGADYVAFGAFFPTQTKQPKTAANPEILTWWQEVMEIPCVAIGGITVENCGSLAAAGADFIAVSSGVWDREGGTKAAVGAFNHTLKNAVRAAG